MDNLTKISMTNTCKDMISYLSKISDVFFEFEKSKRDALEVYRDRALTGKLEGVASAARRAADVSIATLYRCSGNLLEFVNVACVYDPEDPAIANAAQLLSQPGINPLAVSRVLEAFRGEQTALALIFAACSNEHKGAVEAMMFDAQAAVKKMQKTIDSFKYEPVENWPSLVSELRFDLIRFSEKMGLDIGSMSASVEKARAANIASLMGLSLSDL